MTKEALFQFVRTDNDNYRVYYRGRNERTGGWFLYCIQNDGRFGRDEMVFYSCSKDGEPSSPLRMPLKTSFDHLIYPKTLAKSA